MADAGSGDGPKDAVEASPDEGSRDVQASKDENIASQGSSATSKDVPSRGVSAAPRRASSSRRSHAGTLARWVREIAMIVAGALIISTVIRLFVAQMFLIPSGSMENTLQVNDRVLVQKMTHFQRGDIVVFSDPGKWLSETGASDDRGIVGDILVFVGLMPDSSNQHLIKRVIGVPGDTVRCCDATGRVQVNGVSLDETAYLRIDSFGRQSAPSDFVFEAVVPADHVFVMGDHRNNSRDSRCHLLDPGSDGHQPRAFVPVSQIVGTAVWIVYPFHRWGGLDKPTTFAGIPDPPTPPAQAVIFDPGPGC